MLACDGTGQSPCGGKLCRVRSQGRGEGERGGVRRRLKQAPAHSTSHFRTDSPVSHDTRAGRGYETIEPQGCNRRPWSPNRYALQSVNASTTQIRHDNCRSGLSLARRQQRMQGRVVGAAPSGLPGVCFGESVMQAVQIRHSSPSGAGWAENRDTRCLLRLGSRGMSAYDLQTADRLGRVRQVCYRQRCRCSALNESTLSSTDWRHRAGQIAGRNKARLM